MNAVSPGKVLIEGYFPPLFSDFVPGFMTCWSAFLSRESIQQWYQHLREKMTDHRGYALVVMGRPLFTLSVTASGFYIKLKRSSQSQASCSNLQTSQGHVSIQSAPALIAENCCYNLSDGVDHRSSEGCYFWIKHPQLLSHLVALLSVSDPSEQPLGRAAGACLRAQPMPGSRCSQMAAQGAQSDSPIITSICAEFVAHFPHCFGLGQLMLCWTNAGLAQAWVYSLQAVWMRPLCFSGWRVPAWFQAVLCQLVR